MMYYTAFEYLPVSQFQLVSVTFLLCLLGWGKNDLFVFGTFMVAIIYGSVGVVICFNRYFAVCVL